MPRFLESLASNTNVAGKAEFTVNTGVPEVAVSTSGPTPGVDFFGPNLGSAFFEPRDNLILKSFNVQTPHGFRLGTNGGVSCSFYPAYSQGGVVLDIVELSSLAKKIIVPATGFEIEFPPNGLFLDPEASGLNNITRFKFVLVEIENMTVSMAGVPALLNALAFRVQAHMKLLHTRPCTGVP